LQVAVYLTVYLTGRVAGFCPCIGQGFAKHKPCRLRRLVQCGDARSARPGNGEHERRFGINWLVGRVQRLRSEKT
jgi:hypothetical protein